MGTCFCQDTGSTGESKDDNTQHITPAYPKANGVTHGVGKLTAGSLNDHNAAFEASHDYVLLPHSNNTPAITKTLGSDDPEMAAKRAAYLARKESKKKSGKVGSKEFLSGLPELEMDVNYRFNLSVVGHAVTDVLDTVCSSAQANMMPGDLLEKDNIKEEANAQAASNTLGSAASKRASMNKTFRCLCMVTNPMAPNSKEKRKVCKLVFNPKNFGAEIAICNSQLEALRSVIVFMLNVGDTIPDGKTKTFDEQLQCLEESINDMRSRSKPKQRPVRAIILCYPPGTGAVSESAESGWAASLADFESRTGDLWKFGPISTGDANGLHDIFSEVASVRIAHYQNLESTGEDLKKDDDDGHEQVQKDFLIPVPENGTNVGQLGRNRSDSWSECSEGGERPPFFGAECSGSDCSETALELHARTFGLEDDRDTFT